MIPRNVKIWLGNNDNKNWIFEELEDLFSKNNCKQNKYDITPKDQRTCVYIDSNGTYSYGKSLTEGNGSMFHNSQRRNASIAELFPSEPLPQRFTIRVYSAEHFREAIYLLSKCGIINRVSGYVTRPEAINILDKRIDSYYSSISQSEFVAGKYAAEPKLYLSQFLNLPNVNTQKSPFTDVEVSGSSESVSDSQRGNVFRVPGSDCKIAVGKRYTGHATGYSRGNPKVINCKIRSTVQRTGNPSCPIGLDESDTRGREFRQIETGTLLSQYK